MKKINYLLSFIIPFVLMILLYLIVGVIGGDKNILTVDLANQYVEFFGSLKDILSGYISPFYSFSKTLGGNLFGLATYYLISPFNLLIIFFDKIDLPKFVLVINILKVATSGLTSYIYFNKTYKDSKISLAFSIIYSLMAYNIVYSQNIMWLDGVILLPLIFRGIDKLIDGKPLLFYISLTFSIICNYYIGYMSCIASFIYYLYQIYLREGIYFKNVFIIIKYILIAVLTSSFILIPSIFSLMQGKANGMLMDFIPNQRFPVIDIISRFFIGTFKNSDLLGVLPNLYISVIWVVLVIYFFYNKKIDNKEKKATLVLLLVFVISILFSPVNTIWHTLKNPVGFPFRYSFVFDFILLVIAFKSILKMDSIDNNFIKKFLIYGTIITLFMDKFLYDKNTFYKIVGTFILSIIYMYYLKNRKTKSISIFIVLLITIEMFINSSIIFYNIKYQNKKLYENFINETGSIVDYIKDKDKTFYRIEKDYSYSSNDELLLNYSGISHFSSVYESNTNELLKNLGIFNRFYITNYNGSTLVTNSLFNIKYLLSKKNLPYYKNIKKDNINIYENDYNLPLMFSVDKSILDLEIKENVPFVNQNNIIKSMNKNSKDVFYKNDYEIELNNVKLDETSNKTTYLKINDSYKASIKIKVNKKNKGILYGFIYGKEFRKIDLLVDGKSIIDVNDENNYRYNVFELNNNELEIVLLDYKFEPSTIEFYTLDLDNFNEFISDIDKNVDIIYDKDYIKTKVNAKDNEIIYTSIPYDKGFTVIVDGKKVEPKKIFDTLIGIEVEKGTHTIELKYIPRGLKIGTCMSILGVVIFIISKKSKK